MKESDIKKYIDEFESKAQAAFDNYQMTGSNSTLKTKDRYEDLEDICRLALKQVEISGADQDRRRTGIQNLCDTILDCGTYTGETVKNLLWKAY